MINLEEYIRRKKLGIGGIEEAEGNEAIKVTFVNDLEKIERMKVIECGTWYEGDGDRLLNFYTRTLNIDYNYEPFYDRNKRNYFWAESATEEDIKRTHSGIVKTIIDTITGICGEPKITGKYIDNELQGILDENEFYTALYAQEQMPLTLVEGWGAYKIDWDTDLSDRPIVMYYRANDVGFIKRYKRIIGIIYKDFYTDGKKKYLVVETRYRKNGNLYIDKDAFEVFADDDELKPIALKELKFLSNTDDRIEVTNYNGFLGVPCIFFKDTEGTRPGRSIIENKIDLCDDYDQCFSQRANTVRESTPMSYYDTSYLERDPATNLPIAPKSFNRKYTTYKGTVNADGINEGKGPVTVTQPKLDFLQYDGEAAALLTEIVNGILSPASLGVDLAKKDNADAQREKEKVTVFTRNKILKSETVILKKLMNELMCAQELMNTGSITTKEYDIDVEFSEFADDSFENKIGTLSTPLSLKAISPKMYLKKLYGNSLSESEFNEELAYIEEAMNENDSENENDAEFGTDNNEPGFDDFGPEESDLESEGVNS